MNKNKVQCKLWQIKLTSAQLEKLYGDNACVPCSCVERSVSEHGFTDSAYNWIMRDSHLPLFYPLGNTECCSADWSNAGAAFCWKPGELAVRETAERPRALCWPCGLCVCVALVQRLSKNRWIIKRLSKSTFTWNAHLYSPCNKGYMPHDNDIITLQRFCDNMIHHGVFLIEKRQNVDITYIITNILSISLMLKKPKWVKTSDYEVGGPSL